MLFGSTNTYGPSVQIGEDKCAQLMFVIGSDGARFAASKLEKKFRVCNNGTKKGK